MYQKLECTFSLHATVRNINTVGLSYFTVCLVYLLLLLSLAMNTRTPYCCSCYFFSVYRFYRTNIRYILHILIPFECRLSLTIENGIKKCNYMALENKSRFVVIAMNFSVCTAVKNNSMQRKSNKNPRFDLLVFNIILFYFILYFFFRKNFLIFFLQKKTKRVFFIHFSIAWFEKQK